MPLDQVLEALDSDNQAYLRAILVGAGQGLDGRGKDLGACSAVSARSTATWSASTPKVAERDENLSSLVHNLSVLTKSVGTQDQDVMRLVTASNDDARGDRHRGSGHPDGRRLLPGALGGHATTLGRGDRASATSWVRRSTRCGRSPATSPELNSSTTELAETVTPVIRDQIRPVRPGGARADPRPEPRREEVLEGRAEPEVDRGEAQQPRNMAAYNPRGREAVGTAGRDEGYLYWAAWLATPERASSAPGRQRPLSPHLLHGQRLHDSRTSLRRHPGDARVTDLGISFITGIPLDLGTA